MSSPGFDDVKFQVLATVAGNIIVFSFGCNIGWLSPSLPILMSNESPLPSGPLNVSEVGWIGASPALACIFGVLVYGLLATKIGYRNSTQQTVIPITVSWILIIFAQNSWFIMTARFLVGFSGGGMFICIPGFVAEIADDHIRGQLCAYLQTSFYTGVLAGYIGGTFLDYHTNPLVMVTIPLIFLLLFWFIPSSPQHLLKCDQLEAAERSLRFYRNATNASKEKMVKVEKEFEKFKSIAKMNEAGPVITRSDFFTPAAIRAFTIVPTLMFVSQLSGAYTISNYAATIFKETGSTFDPNISSIVMGVVQVCGNITASQLIDRIGRKKLLLMSNSGAAISNAITGTFIYLGKSGYDVSAFNLLPVISISFFIFINAIGILPVPYVILAELMPQKIRKIGSTMCTMAAFIVQFGILKTFPLMLETIELYGCIWFFAGIVTFGFLFTLIVVKETKGKNLDVIEENK